MFLSADQLLAHLIGDYLLQSHWMATEKTKRTVAALAHVLTYQIPFWLLTRPSWTALSVIVVSHFIIDRWRLARFVVWAKNHIGPLWRDDKCQHICEPRDPFNSPRRCQKRPTAASVYCLRHAGAHADDKSKVVYPWSVASKTGYGPDCPDWLAFSLLIVADNIMHIVCNALALKFL